MFNQMIPVIYWSIENLDLTEDMEKNLTKNFPHDYKKCKSAHGNACNKIKHSINGNTYIINSNLYIKYYISILFICKQN